MNEENTKKLLTDFPALFRDALRSSSEQQSCMGRGFECGDSPSHDWPLVASIFDEYGWPANLLRKCGEIGFKSPSKWRKYQAGLATFWKDHSAQQHHALVDARSLDVAWKLANRRGF